MLFNVVKIFQGNRILLAMLGVACGFIILFVPFQVFIIALLVFAVFISFFRSPKMVLAIVAIYLLFQSFVVFQFKDIPQLDIIFRRSEEVVILICFVITVFKNITLNKTLWKRSDIDIPLSLLVVIAAYCSVANQIVPPYIACFDLFLLLKGFMVFYIFYNLDFNSDDISKITRVFFRLALIIWLFGITDLIAPHSFRALIRSQQFVEYRFGIPGVQSIFTHPGQLGWFMAFCVCLSLAFYSVMNKNKYLVIFLIFFSGAIMSMRFKPMIGVSFAILALFFIISGKRRTKIMLTVCCFLLLFTALFGAKAKLLIDDKMYSYLQGPQLESVSRNALYLTSFRIAKDYLPFGSGLGTFGGWIAAIYYSPLYAKYGISTVYGIEEGGEFLVDTFWPYIVGQFGVMGTVCYVWIFVLFFHRLAVYFNKERDVLVKAFILGTIMVLCEAMAESLAVGIFSAPPSFFFIFACLGIAHSFYAKDNNFSKTAAVL